LFQGAALEASDKYCEHTFPNVLSIRNISEIHKNITALFQSNSSVVFDIPADAEVDLSFVQLVESARVDAKTSGKSLRLSSPASGSVLRVLQRGGFIDTFSAEDAQFWLHEEVQQ
jgi:hypothetical protein